MFVITGSSADVSVISDRTNQIIENQEVDFNVQYAAYDSSKGELFLSGYAQGSVYVMSDSTYESVANVAIGSGTFGKATTRSRARSSWPISTPTRSRSSPTALMR